MAYGPFAPGEEVTSVFNDGERYIPTVDPYNAAMHLGHMASYKEALRHAYGRLVLDLGCGAGYGAHYLASFGADRVIAADVDWITLEYARTNYPHPRVHYLCLDGNQQLPFADGIFEFVFSSQVIEHIAGPLHFLAEIKRVLQPGGFCLIITPNKDIFSPGCRGISSEFHINEMNLAEYEKLGRAVFPRVQMAGIPQNCLIVHPDNTVAAKPEELLRLEDYRMRRDGLIECENLLLFGHTQSDGHFDVLLPDALSGASTNLTPCFWDAHTGRWIELGIYPKTSVPIDSPPGSCRVLQQRFRSPYDHLFRIDIALADTGTCAVEATLRCDSESGPIVFHEVVEPVGKKLHLIFDPIAGSVERTYYLELRRQSSILDILLARVKRKSPPEFEYRGGELAFWTFHQTLPPAKSE